MPLAAAAKYAFLTILSQGEILTIAELEENRAKQAVQVWRASVQINGCDWKCSASGIKF